MTNETKNLIKGATNALEILDALYVWYDHVEKVGGTTSIAGIAAAQAMFTSMKKQRSRVESLVVTPLKEAIYQAKDAK